jgi:type IV secretion system protein VirB10
MGTKNEPIDAGAELDQLEAQRQAQEEEARLSGDRGGSALGASRRPVTPGAKTLLWVVVIAVLAVGGAFSWKAYQIKSARAEAAANADPKEADAVKNRLPPLKHHEVAPEPAPAPAAAASAAVPPITPNTGPTPTAYGQQPPKPKSPAELLRERRLSGGFGDSSAQASTAQLPPGMPQAGQQPGAGAQGELGGGGRGGLADRLQPLKLTAAAAGRLSDPDYTLTMGTPIDCILYTRIVSTVPGLVECYLDRDIYSASGRVVLLDRQTKLTGHWQGGLQQGQARIFLVWARAETPAPNHVIVNLDSPAAGPLGEGGIGGHIDTHFWQRFGGAIMLSMIDDVAASVSRPSYGSGNQISFGNTSDAAQDMAGKALENSINIPPTLYENHGKRVSVMLARDVNFREVYELRAK